MKDEGRSGADSSHRISAVGGRRYMGQDRPTLRQIFQATKKAWRLVLVSCVLAGTLLVLAFTTSSPKVIEKNTHTIIEKPGPTTTRTAIIEKPGPVSSKTVIVVKPTPGPTITRTA